MTLASVYCRAQIGIDAPKVLVEVHMASGLPKINLVGLAEIAVKESVERVRSAIVSSNYKFKPSRITINLSPANLPKHGTRYDLPIAIALLKAMGEINANISNDYEFYGELGLDGSLRATGGLIPAILKAAREGKKIFLPKDDAYQARLLNCNDTLKNVLYPITDLNQLCSHLENSQIIEPLSFEKAIKRKILIDKDIKEVQGQIMAKRTLEIASCGFHNLLMIGPPGSGKSMLAERIPYILPSFSDLELEEALSIYSIANQPISKDFIYQRPFRSPHHSASAVALVGGGRIISPGEISLSHTGVLFLDELAEFKRETLEALRQPMETGRIQISRAARQVEFPAQFLLIAAMNGCPCGNLGSNKKNCVCSQEQISRYRSKISGPLLDRIDMHLTIKPVDKNTLFKQIKQESSYDIKQRVEITYQKQIQRQKCPNAKLSNGQIKQFIQLNDDAKTFLFNAIDKFNLSTRSYYKVQKVALTIADLMDEEVSTKHLAEALSYRGL